MFPVPGAVLGTWKAELVWRWAALGVREGLCRVGTGISVGMETLLSAGSWLCFLVHFHAHGYTGTNILLCELSFSWTTLLQQHSFPFCLQLGIFCFIVTDFLTAGEENICQDVSSEQEILIALGRSSAFSKVFPAVEILVCTLRSKILWGKTLE